MDLSRLKARGDDRSDAAWPFARSMRAAVWRLVSPYLDEMMAWVEEKTVIQDAAIRAAAASSAASSTTSETFAAATSKDITAMQHRLAAMEEILERVEQAQATLAQETAKMAELAATAAIDRVRADAALPAADAAGEPQPSKQRLLPAHPVHVGTNGLVLVALTEETRFLVREHDLIGRIVANGQEWEPHVRAAIEGAANMSGVAIDAGAYIGLHTVTMSRLFQTVHAFEPQEHINRLLCGNLVLNDCKNVVVHQKALYDLQGLMRLAPPERQEVPVPLLQDLPDYSQISNAAALTFEITDTAGAAGTVDAITIDQLALDNVAFIKVDTQGADLHVLKGAERTIAHSRPIIVFEWERDLGAQHQTSLEDYMAFFERHDYAVTLSADTSPGRQADYVAIPRKEGPQL